MQQRQKPTAARFRHEAQRAVTVSDGNRLLPFDNDGLMFKGTVAQRPGLRTRPRRIIADQHRTLRRRQGCGLQLEQRLLIHRAVLQGRLGGRRPT